jgi:putative transposase
MRRLEDKPSPRRRSCRLPLHLYAEEGRILLVTATTSPRAPVFADQRFAFSCRDLLLEIADESETDVFAYCLMPDHVHFVLGIGELPLPRLMQQWKSLSYKVWREHGGRASFWQRGYYETFLRDTKAVREAVQYTLGNPVRSGLVSAVREYPLCGSVAWENAKDW